MNKVEQAVIELDGEWPADKLTPGTIFFGGEPVSRPAFMQTRKRLENKPTEWPSWVNSISQTESGEWWGFSGFTYLTCGHVGDYCDKAGRAQKLSQGHVFGDWRQSLQRRPQEGLKEGEDDFAIAWGRVVKALNKHVPGWMGDTGSGVDNAVAAIERLSANKSEPEPQWVPGETLPPVGSVAVCTYTREEHVIRAHDNIADPAMALTFDDNGGYWGADVYHWEQVKSHRDKVIEAAIHQWVNDAVGDNDVKRLVSLYDAGFLKLPEGE